MNIKKVFSGLSKGCDISKKLTKDDDTKDILIGLSAILGLAISAVTVYENIAAFKKRITFKK